MRAALIGLIMAPALANAAGAQAREPVWPPRPPVNQEAPPNTFWAKSMTFTRHSGFGTDCFVDGVWRRSFHIYAVGHFDAGATRRLQAFLQANPPVPFCTTIHFHSPGGDLDQGIAMGRLIRAQKLRTSIEILIVGAREMVRRSAERAICFSSCSYAFLGGVLRTAGDGHYGVHRFYRGEPSDAIKRVPRDWRTDDIFIEQSQVKMAELLAYVVAMDVNPDLLLEAARAAGTVPLKEREPNQNFLSRETMARLRVTTARSVGQWEVVNLRGAAAVRAIVPEGDAKHAVLLSCERSSPGAGAELRLTLFFETRAPDAFLASRKLRIWRRDKEGRRVHGVVASTREEFAVPNLERAAASAAKDLAGGRPGLIANIPVKALRFDLSRQTEIYFGFAARAVGRNSEGSATDTFDNGFTVDMSAGAQRIAGLMATCQ